jgi:hypothetical protein
VALDVKIHSIIFHDEIWPNYIPNGDLTRRNIIVKIVEFSHPQQILIESGCAVNGKLTFDA